jgi:hypothetical protein
VARVDLTKLGNEEQISAKTRPIDGWRLALGDRTGVSFSADIDQAGAKVRGATPERPSDSLFQAARQLETLPEVAASAVAYEPWILNVPELYTDAFWLKSDAGDKDVIVPIRSAQNLRRGYAYSPEDFLTVMKNAAADPTAKIPAANRKLRPAAAAEKPREKLLKSIRNRRADRQEKARWEHAVRLELVSPEAKTKLRSASPKLARRLGLGPRAR